MNKELNSKFTRDFLEGLQVIIGKVLTTPTEDDNDKLLYCVIASINTRISKKLCDDKSIFSIKFDPAELIALRLLYTGFVNDTTSFIGNKLHQISNEVHKRFS